MTAPEQMRADGTLDYRVSWPRAATPCDLVPLWKGEFRDYADWVNFAANRLTGTTDASGREIKSICVDALGRRCSIGGDFMRARDENAFPVRYFWECVPATRPATDELVEALAEYDRVVAACPANKTHLGDKPCPKCRAMSNEGCREESRAAFAFIQAARTALRNTGAVS